MRKVAGVFQRLARFGGLDQPFFLGCGKDFTDGCALFGAQTKALSKALVGHVVVHQVAEAGVEVAGVTWTLVQAVA